MSSDTLITPISNSSSSGEHAELELLQAARDGSPEDIGRLLECYRNYLTILSRTQLGGRLRARANPSDVVQETMLDAYRDFGRFTGDSEREFLAWLRQILINNLRSLYEHHVQTAKRDVRAEIPIDQIATGIDRAARSFGGMFASPVSTPSRAASRRETGVIVANLLAELPSHYREVIVLRNLQGLPFDKVADEMERTSAAVRMMWLRAIDRFRELSEEFYQDTEDRFDL